MQQQHGRTTHHTLSSLMLQCRCLSMVYWLLYNAASSVQHWLISSSRSRASPIHEEEQSHLPLHPEVPCVAVPPLVNDEVHLIQRAVIRLALVALQRDVPLLICESAQPTQWQGLHTP